MNTMEKSLAEMISSGEVHYCICDDHPKEDIEKVRQEAIMEVIDEIPDAVFNGNTPQGVELRTLKDQLKTKFLLE